MTAFQRMLFRNGCRLSLSRLVQLCYFGGFSRIQNLAFQRTLCEWGAYTFDGITRCLRLTTTLRALVVQGQTLGPDAPIRSRRSDA